MASQVADYEITSTVFDDGVVPCLRARLPQRLGSDGVPVTIWVLGPLARTPWATARARFELIAAAHGGGLPRWLEAGVGEWAQRPVLWVSATTAVTGTLASAGPEMSTPARLRAIASAARGAHALHEVGQLHGAICPQAVALVAGETGGQATGAPAVGGEAATSAAAVLAPPSLADGDRPLVLIGYPPLGYVDPQLLRGEGGRWSDIWALGATVHHAVTGSPPFPGIDELPVVRALAQLLAAPSPATAEMPPGLSGLVTSCLTTDPETRPATANEVADRLEEAAAAL